MIRPTAMADVDRLKNVIDGTGLFPSAMLDDMIAPYLSGNAHGDIWLTSDYSAPTSLLYCAPERMTQGTWNMLLIAVDLAVQGKGIGSTLTRSAEATLTERGARVLLVETSGFPEFELARRFYRARGYAEEALIRDFYRDGEDKIVFWKKLK